jgi:thermitase
MTIAITRSWLAASLGLLAAIPVLADDDKFEPDRCVVVLKPGVGIVAINSDYGTIDLESVPGRRLYYLDIPDGQGEEGFAALLAIDPRIELASVNFYAADPDGGGQSFFLSVNPPQYASQYSVAMLGLPAAHGFSTGDGVVVAVLDTGADADHPALDSKLLPGYNFIQNNTNTADVPDSLDSDGDGLFDEMVGHGTFIAGLVALVAPSTKILPVKVLDSDGRGTSFNVAKGVDFAIAQGAHIINASLGTVGDNTVLDLTTQWASTAGVLVVAAAGNESTSSSMWSPASSSWSIAIAGTDAQDVRASFSNYGEHIDLCAPSVGIVSCVPGGGFGVSDGTSFGTPMVSATLALVRSRAPQATVTKIRDVVFQSVIDIQAQNPGYLAGR